MKSKAPQLHLEYRFYKLLGSHGKRFHESFHKTEKIKKIIAWKKENSTRIIIITFHFVVVVVVFPLAVPYLVISLSLALTLFSIHLSIAFCSSWEMKISIELISQTPSLIYVIQNQVIDCYRRFDECYSLFASSRSICQPSLGFCTRISAVQIAIQS